MRTMRRISPIFSLYLHSAMESLSSQAECVEANLETESPSQERSEDARGRRLCWAKDRVQRFGYRQGRQDTAIDAMSSIIGVTV